MPSFGETGTERAFSKRSETDDRPARQGSGIDMGVIRGQRNRWAIVIDTVGRLDGWTAGDQNERGVHALQCHLVQGLLTGSLIENQVKASIHVIELEEALYRPAREHREQEPS